MEPITSRRYIELHSSTGSLHWPAELLPVIETREGGARLHAVGLNPYEVTESPAAVTALLDAARGEPRLASARARLASVQTSLAMVDRNHAQMPPFELKRYYKTMQITLKEVDAELRPTG